MYKIEYTKKSMKFLYKYDRIFKQKLEQKIFEFLEWKKADIKRLQWYNQEIYRLRIGKYRVIFEKQDDKLIILVLDIWSRWDIYK